MITKKMWTFFQKSLWKIMENHIQNNYLHEAIGS